MSRAPLVVIPPIATDPGMLEPIGFDRIVLTPSELILVEYPGHGTRAPEPGITIAQLANEVAASIDPATPADIVGIGMGAYVLADLIANHRELVRSAVIVSSPVTPVDEARRDSDRATGASAREGMHAIIENTIERWFTEAAIVTGRPGVAAARDSLAALRPEVWDDFWQAIAGRVTLDEEELRELTLPVTVVAPLHDPSDNAARLRDIDSVLPLSRLVYLNGGHMVHLEQPESVLAAIDSHLAWSSLGAEATEPPALLWIGE